MTETPAPLPTLPLVESAPAASPTARLGRDVLHTDSPAELPPRELPAYAPSKLLRLR